MASFYESLRESQKKSNDDAQNIKDFNEAVSSYASGYAKWAKENNGKFKSSNAADIESRLRKMVKQAGISDGTLTDKSSDAEIAAYGKDFITNLTGEQNFGVVDYIRKYGTKEQQDAYNKMESAAQREAEINRDPVKAGFRNAALLVGGMGGLGGFIGAGAAAGALDRAKTNATLDKATDDYNKWLGETNKSGYDIFENYEKYAPTSDDKKNSGSSSSNSNNDTKSGNEDTVTFTLPRANDPSYRGFGQKIVDLGLATDKGLWGADGDVQFYTKQLYEQGALDRNGNLKIGVPIKLRRRK